MDANTRTIVRERANNRCEYCLLPQEYSAAKHQIEHIRAKQHGGSNSIENLALACQRCNLFKGPNLSGIDPTTGNPTPLFNPRCDRWADHFKLRRVVIEGLTPIGRATVHLLAMNDSRRLELRLAIMR